MSDFFIGLDLGQVQDYTALAIIERVFVTQGPSQYQVRHIQRFELGTSYVNVIEKVYKLFSREELSEGAYLVTDLTGVGRPVYDLMIRQGLHPIGITITGGNESQRDDHGYRVPKRELVSCLQILFQSGRLKISKKLPYVEVLIQELFKFIR